MTDETTPSPEAAASPAVTATAAPVVAPAPVHLTQADVASFAASLGKAVTDLTSDDFKVLAVQHGGAIVVDQPAATLGDLEAGHRAYVPPANVPVRVPMLSFKLTLFQLGVYEDVAAAAKADPLAEIYWTSAANAERLDDRVIRMALGFGWGPSRLDEVFVLAGSK